ncbi:TolC family protein [Phragmitibacter flavus]|uniref:TolC family protein n=1 Tax=Phragmitibacter flavus TaxID=2576071 RepID=A0A5R8K978_9BACT|nr:TolC family protein [Phragmitibacter flavus]TLD68882.1 TolC family protein [Phragmitibacter flavus]
MLPQFFRSHTAATALLLATLAACTPSQMRKSADREVNQVLKQKTSTVPNSGDQLLDITPPGPASLDTLATNKKAADFLGDSSHIEKNARVIPLHEALRLSITHNRDYLSRKELLHLQALDLTLARHQFTPILTAFGSGRYENIQTPAINELIRENTFTTTGTAGLSILTRTGARLATDFTTDFLRFLSGNVTQVRDSVLAVTLTQPLLRGAGQRATMETLTQAERDLLYSIRDFTQYRKTFAVDIATQYYRTLQAREAAQNAHFAYQGFQKILPESRALVTEGKRTESQIGLIEQASLRYERLWINSIRNYESQLDDLKISLGIPVQTTIIPDPKELTKLSIEDPVFTYDQSIDTALTARLDLHNNTDSLEDTRRRIKLGEQNLLPQIDLTGGYQINSDPGKTSLNTDRRKLGAGLDVDLRLDKKADRNAYQSALIAEQTATRELDLAQETVRSALRTDWRDLQTAQKQYEIAQTGITLSDRLFENERLLNEVGRGSTRDLVDAQQDLIEARDALTAALVSHNIARLNLWKDMGILYIQKDGAWERVLSNEAK